MDSLLFSKGGNTKHTKLKYLGHAICNSKINLSMWAQAHMHVWMHGIYICICMSWGKCLGRSEYNLRCWSLSFAIFMTGTFFCHSLHIPASLATLWVSQDPFLSTFLIPHISIETCEYRHLCNSVSLLCFCFTCDLSNEVKMLARALPALNHLPSHGYGVSRAPRQGYLEDN